MADIESHTEAGRMTQRTYLDWENGEVVDWYALYGQLREGRWTGDKQPDGTYLITDHNGNERTLEPIE